MMCWGSFDWKPENLRQWDLRRVPQRTTRIPSQNWYHASAQVGKSESVWHSKNTTIADERRISSPTSVMRRGSWEHLASEDAPLHYRGALLKSSVSISPLYLDAVDLFVGELVKDAAPGHPTAVHCRVHRAALKLRDRALLLSVGCLPESAA